MKHKINELKDYIINKLEDREELELLCDLLSLDYDDDATKPILIGRLLSICSAIDAGFIEDSEADAFKQVFKLRDYESAYTIAKDLFFHYFLAITVSLADHPKEVNRQLLVPIRASLGDVIYAILAAFRCDGSHLCQLFSKGYRFEPTAIKDEESDCADAYPSFILYDLVAPKVFYDFGEGYEFKIRMRKPKRIDGDECWDSVILQNGKGYGIIEDSHYALDNYFEIGDFILPEDKDEIDADWLLVDKDRDYRDIDYDELNEELEGSYQYLRERYIFGYCDSDYDYSFDNDEDALDEYPDENESLDMDLLDRLGLEPDLDDEDLTELAIVDGDEDNNVN